MNSSKKSVFSPLVIAVLMIILGVMIIQLFDSPRGGARIHFFNVGQGDAALLTSVEDQNVLIDGGPNEIILERLDSVIPFYRRKLDAVILTHPHSDHLVGLLSVIKNYEVKKVYFTGVVHTTPEYLEFLKLIKERNIEVVVPRYGDKLVLADDLSVEFLFPLKDVRGQRVANLNETSIVNRVIYGQSKVLLTGDLEILGQYELLSVGKNIEAEIIKVPHHGSKDSFLSEFYKKVNPKFAVISVGEKNKFNHPHPSVINGLRGVQVFRTDQDGSMTFILDKNEIRFKKN